MTIEQLKAYRVDLSAAYRATYYAPHSDRNEVERQRIAREIRNAAAKMNRLRKLEALGMIGKR